jgi:hypothetical protein
MTPQTAPTDHLPDALKSRAVRDAESMRNRAGKSEPTPEDLAEAAEAVEAARPPSVVDQLRAAVELGQAGRLACPAHRVASIVAEFTRTGCWSRDGRVSAGNPAMTVGRAGARLLSETTRPGFSPALHEFDPSRQRLGEATITNPEAVRWLAAIGELDGTLIVLDESATEPGLDNQTCQDLEALAQHYRCGIAVVGPAEIGTESFSPGLKP